MDGSIWLFLALILVVVCFALVGVRWRRFAADLGLRHCPHCQTPMSMRRVSLLEPHAVFGEWVCPHCETRMDRKGKVPEAA